MKINNANYLVYFFLLLFFQPISVVSQEKKTFKSKNFSYNKDITGTVSYDYILKNLDTILNGPFLFKSIQELSDLTYEYKTISLQGIFSENLKNDKWQFAERKLSTSNNSTISDYNILITTSGIEKQVNGYFKNGMPDGEWKVVELNFENSTPKDTISKISAAYKDGEMYGLFKSESPTFKITGAFNEQGFFHGEWTYNHRKNIIETRRFENGVLLNIIFTVNNQNYVFDYLGLEKEVTTDESWVEIEIKNTYFELLELLLPQALKSQKFDRSFNFDSLVKVSDQRTLKNIEIFGKHNNLPIWNLSINKQKFNYGKFRLKQYTIPEEDSVLITNIANKFKQINEDINFFTQYPKIRIKSLSNDKLARVGAVYDVYRNGSKELNYLVKVISSTHLKFIDYKTIVKKFLPLVELNTQTNYQFQESVIELNRNFPSVDAQSEMSLEELSNLADAIFDDVNRQNELVKIILSDSEKQDLIKEFEDTLFEKGDEVISLFSNSKSYEDYNKFHKNVSPIILTHTKKIISNYESLQVNDKGDQIQELINCFESYIKFWDDLIELSKKYNYLDQEYSRIVFNPFLMSDIKERLKERVYRAYDEYLMPYIFRTSLDTNLECINVSNVIENFDTIYNRMLEIKEIDTKQEETNLRRQRDVSKILSILNITLN